MRARRTTRTRLACAVATALLLSACAPASDGTSQESGGRAEVEVFTWWASGSEKRGLDALVEVFAEQHPDIGFVNGAIAGGAGSAAKDLLQSRLEAGDPPDTFQAHAGAELSDYIAAGQLEDLSALYDELDLRDAFPADLVDRLTVDGKIYSVPAAIHRSNVVWANPAVLAEAGLDPAAEYPTLEDWFPALDAVEAAGRTPLSVGTTWTQVHLLENVLLAELGPDAYSGLWDGTTDWLGPEVTDALATFDRLIGYTNVDRDGLDWPDATRRVIDGEAAFTVMGDWAVAAFEEAGQEVGSDVLAFPVPGTDGEFNFLADSFTLPVGAPNPDGTRAWLATVASSAGQTALSKAKGSIPARTDADHAEVNAYQRSAMESFGRDRIVPSLAHGAAAPVAVLNAISAATAEFTSGATGLLTFQAQLADAASAG